MWKKSAISKVAWGLESKNDGVRQAAREVQRMLKAKKPQSEIIRTSAYGILVRYWNR